MTSPTFFRRLTRKLDKTVASWFFIDQWVLLTGHNIPRQSLTWNALRPLLPPKDRYWSDPFAFQRDNCNYVFIEEKLYATGLGRIACLTLDDEGKLLSQQVVLQRPYHLSYPFIFEHAGDLFMVPETASHRTVELYRCLHFPDRWEFVKDLLTDVYAVDATLLQHLGKWWLFANVKVPGGSSLDALCLYSASDLLLDPWLPHPLNPIVKDIRSARPAGRIFAEDGNLIRPSQDSSSRYGYALKFNRITAFSETDYVEVPVGAFTPRGSRYLATHTFNQAGDITVIDAVLRRQK
jgi:hypothetical protein